MLIDQASLTRNSMVTFGGVTPLEMAFGRRPPDIIGVDNADPAQLTVSDLVLKFQPLRVRSGGSEISKSHFFILL